MRTIYKRLADVWCHVLVAVVIGLVCLAASSANAQDAGAWQQRVDDQVKAQHIDAALVIVDQRLASEPEDYEAHGWRGRLLSWKGRWPEAESEYRLVLNKFPDDIDILAGLADVLIWQHKNGDALQVLEHAKKIAPSDPEILSREARVLALLGRTSDSRSEYAEILKLDPGNEEARANLIENTKHELRVENDTDFLSFANNAETQSFNLSSRWNQQWSTVFNISTYQRFGEDAGRFLASGAFHFANHSWVSVGTAIANAQGVVPTNEAFFEAGHGFHLDNRFIQGLESSYQQHWFWYQGAHVLTLSTSQIAYLPRGWTWSLNVTGARTGFSGTPVGWEPSGWTKLGFPLYGRLTGNLLFGVGSENFFQIDQIEQFSAHTYGGGLRYQLRDRQDVQGFVAYEARSLGQTDTTLGLSYGIRF